MPTDRSAFATIKGFLYQFDATILTILEKKDDSLVDVEGIEDIDINDVSNITTAVQCKYYESTELTPSLLKDPILKMVEGFLSHRKNGRELKYILYGYYKNYNKGVLNDAGEVDITFDVMKNKILKGKVAGVDRNFQTELNASDHDIQEFLKVFNFKKAKDFDDQHAEVILQIQKSLNCDKQDVELFFYNSALTLVVNMAKERDDSKRSISKVEFLKKINQKRVLFLTWVQEIKGEKYFIKLLKEKITGGLALSPSKRKALFLDMDYLDFSDGCISLFSLIFDLTNKYFRIGERDGAKADAQPWIFVMKMDEGQIKEFKIELIKNNLFFNDGYENIEFNSTYFNKKPVINVSRSKRITNSSFNLKLVSSQTIT